LAFEINKYRQLLLQNCCRATDRFFGVERTVGFEIENQLVKVSALLYACALDHIGHTYYRTESSVELQAANGTSLIINALTSICRHVTTTARNTETHIERAATVKVCDDMLGILDFDTVVNLDVACRDQTGALFRQGQNRLILTMHDNRHAFQVEKNFDHIFLNAFKCAVFVQHAFNFSTDNCTTWHRRQQNATEGIAKGMAKSAFEWLQCHLGSGRADLLHFDDSRS